MNFKTTRQFANARDFYEFRLNSNLRLDSHKKYNNIIFGSNCCIVPVLKANMRTILLNCSDI